jgi:hypothetical protein
MGWLPENPVQPQVLILTLIIDHRYSRLGEAGDLFIDLRPHLDVRLRFAPWEAGMTVARWTGQGWETETTDPQIALLDRETLLYSETPISRYAQKIPAEIRAAATPFAYHQLTLLQWAAQDPYARDLLLSNPMLLWLLVDAVPYLEVVSHLLREKQQVLLEVLLGTGTKPMLRLLRHLQLWQSGSREIRLLRQVLKNPRVLTALNRFPVINRTLLVLAERWPEVITLPIVTDLPLQREMPTPKAMVWANRVSTLRGDLLRIGALLGNQDYQKTIDRCTSLEQLQRLHDRWTERMNRSRRLSEEQILFPTPPLSGNDVIRPILTLAALTEEGRMMRHCVRSYADRVFCGKSYFYQVLSPERGTLELNLKKQPPAIAQFRLARNRIPSSASWHQVTRWLHEATGSKI